jgi:magnesium transporter
MSERIDIRLGEGTEDVHAVVQAIQTMLERDSREDLLAYVGGIHPSDMADIVEHLEDAERLLLLEVLPAEEVADALSEMEEEEHPEELLVQMEPERIAEVVHELADDDAADLIGELKPEEQARVLESVPDHDEREIRELLDYPEDSAGGIMTRELLAVPYGAPVGEALKVVREKGRAISEFFTIFVTDAAGRLKGVVSLQEMVLASPDQPLAELVVDPPAMVPVDMDQEEVGRILSRYNLASIGVVDPLGRLVGRVTFDDVIDVVEAESTEDILRFAAVSEEEELRGSTADAVRSRLPWLTMNLATLSLAALVVWFYRETIEQAAILAAVMPVIAGLGGNAGTQALAVTIRRIAVAEESLAERWSVVRKELLVGIINGFAIGLVVAVAGFLIPGTRPLFGLVVMVAMWGNLVIASTAGAFFPILLESFGIDPAVASSVFVTTFTDFFGFFLLLALATAVLV